MRTNYYPSTLAFVGVAFLGLALTGGILFAQTPGTVPTTPKPGNPAMIEAGQTAFLQNCAFCHGRDAGGGETGPDLTRSKLVATDVDGDQIGPVIRNGRPQNGMPPFRLPDKEIAGLVAFIHDQKMKADAHVGGRRGVDVADLQTGNVEEGKRYFNGAGTCSSCHSPTADLAHVAQRFEGLKLEQRFLYPRNVKPSITVTLANGQSVTGKLTYQDEFTIGIVDSSGWYRSWPVSRIKYTIDAPAEAHARLLTKYTDDDIHNLMAYLQTLK